jgi:hypothetical protein
MMPRGSDGNGYIAQARELELAKRDNQRLMIEVSTRDTVIDQLRATLNQEEARSRELDAITTHHVRTAFCLGLGVGVMVCVIVWGVVLLLR